MIIKECKGYELEKAKPNTSEDFFNRSEVTFTLEGEEKTFHLLYLRFFDESFNELTPYSTDPVFKVGERDVYFKDIVGLICMLVDSGFRQRKRVYINSEEEFSRYFKDIDFDKLPEIFEGIQKGGYQLESAGKFLNVNV